MGALMHVIRGLSLAPTRTNPSIARREEAERALAGPVQVDVVRAARLRRLAGGGEVS